jgi:hypothetical protein
VRRGEKREAPCSLSNRQHHGFSGLCWLVFKGDCGGLDHGPVPRPPPVVSWDPIPSVSSAMPSGKMPPVSAITDAAEAVKGVSHIGLTHDRVRVRINHRKGAIILYFGQDLDKPRNHGQRRA